ncbi:MDR family MFS transporter [Streptomyces sp. NPDC047108]|uniref:MDR family MFS transporter n=1 Tax=Streptomyces sp. NPDC047108 TaxID=3155025 RepID=UPI0033CC835E
MTRAAEPPAEPLPAEPLHPAPPVLSRRRTNAVFVTIVLGLMLAALDQLIISTALPTIVAELGGAGHMAWVVTAYLLTETVATVLVGRFGDVFGRKVVFQVSAVVFVLGSIAAGVAGSMPVLITGRAIQGAGAGGLLVTAMALIADVIPLRQRGRYQGALGAVFGITTVVGPTLGGFLTDQATWRWCFYVNIPIAVVMLVMAARTIPAVRAAVRPVIDYKGIVLVALGASALVLALEWGGRVYAWNSAIVIGLLAASVALLTGFVFAELRAREPVIPMDLFRNPVFTVCSILSFIVGFSLLGALTYLPTYLQYVDGITATASGVLTLPLVVGLLGTAVLSGEVVSRTGRYRVFPVLGTGLMTLGLLLMSTMGASTGVWLETLYMFVLGLGIGLTMQVLTIVVQNTVPYHELGAATSGVTFFRTLGAAFGTAVFGSLYAGRLEPNLARAHAEAPGVPDAVVQSPEGLHGLDPDVAAPFIGAYAETVANVFLWVVPVALAGFLVSWFLKEVPLRDSARAGALDIGEGFAAPDAPDTDLQLARAVAGVMRRTEKPLTAELLADCGSTLSAGEAWALGQVHWRTRAGRRTDPEAVAAAHRMPAEVLEPVFRQVVGAGYAAWGAEGRLRLTAAGRSEIDRLTHAWRHWLDTRLEDWDVRDPDDRARLDRALDHLAEELLEEEEARYARTPV